MFFLGIIFYYKTFFSSMAFLAQMHILGDIG